MPKMINFMSQNSKVTANLVSLTTDTNQDRQMSDFTHGVCQVNT